MCALGLPLKRLEMLLVSRKIQVVFSDLVNILHLTFQWAVLDRGQWGPVPLKTGHQPCNGPSIVPILQKIPNQFYVMTCIATETLTD